MLDLSERLQGLPENADEQTVCVNFLQFFLESLDFHPFNEICIEFKTGQGIEKVDFAGRKNIDGDLFIKNPLNPYLILEAKRRDINLAEGSTFYKSTVNKLKRYLLAPNCKTVKWGLICNANHIQLFRKHGKVIHPASQYLEINPDNIVEITNQLRDKIWNSPPALTVAIYNNKGGVGKTTTTVNLAGVLTIWGKKVLVIDFDPPHGDLTKALGKKDGVHTLFDVLKGEIINIQTIIDPFIYIWKNKKGEKKQSKFDIIPAPDDKPFPILFKQNKLNQVLEPLRAKYDYILIDSPPNDDFFSESAIYAADVVLIPTKPNGVFSLNNAAGVISQIIPKIQKLKNDGSPVALPIFFNGEKIPAPMKKIVNDMIIDLIDKILKKKKFDLQPWFFPKWTEAAKDMDIFELPPHAIIAKAAFKCLPAVFIHKTAFEYYSQLAKEYFLQ